MPFLNTRLDMMELGFRKNTMLGSIRYLTFDWNKSFVRVPCNCCFLIHLSKYLSQHGHIFASIPVDMIVISHLTKRSRNALTASTPMSVLDFIPIILPKNE